MTKFISKDRLQEYHNGIKTKLDTVNTDIRSAKKDYLLPVAWLHSKVSLNGKKASGYYLDEKEWPNIAIFDCAKMREVYPHDGNANIVITGRSSGVDASFRFVQRAIKSSYKKILLEGDASSGVKYTCTFQYEIAYDGSMLTPYFAIESKNEIDLDVWFVLENHMVPFFPVSHLFDSTMIGGNANNDGTFEIIENDGAVDISGGLIKGILPMLTGLLLDTKDLWLSQSDNTIPTSGCVNKALDNAKLACNQYTRGLVSSKVDKVTGKGLSTNDFTTAYKEKLDGIEAEANKIVVDDAMSKTSENAVMNKAVGIWAGNLEYLLGTYDILGVGTHDSNMVIATPDGSKGKSALRKLVAADLPDLSSKYQVLDINGYQNMPLIGGATVGYKPEVGFLKASINASINGKVSPNWYYATDGTLQDINIKIAPAQATITGILYQVNCVNRATEVYGTSVDTLAITAASADGTINGAVETLILSTSSSEPLITIGGVVWANGNEPTFQANKTYEISIKAVSQADNTFKFLATFAEY